jgi:methanethiol S-methyltransferase
MTRLPAFLFGLVSYVLFLATVLYGVGFVGNIAVPKTIDSGVGGSTITAILVDVILIALFGLQHSIMARPAFKRQWTRLIAEPVERSVYVLLSSLCLLLLFWLWRPVAGEVWNLAPGSLHMLLTGLYWFGWLMVVASSFLIDHFDLFGLRQLYFHARGLPYAPVPFKQPVIYRYVRHPMMVGFFIAFWATPSMSAGRFLFALGMSVYIVIGTLFEERDLLRAHGERYAQYRRQVAMFFPLFGKRDGGDK